MTRVHPVKRAQIAIAVFAFCGVAVGFSANPAQQPQIAAPTNTPLAVDDVSVQALPRRAWREQLPAIIVVRRGRAS